MNSQEAKEFLKTHRQAILATIKKDGRPQLSNVLAVYKDDALMISIAESRAKYKNLVRDPRATVHLLGDTFWQYLVVDGEATMTHMPEALPQLREYYELATGGAHPNWDEYDEAMERERRVLLRVSIDHVYPLSE